MTLKALAIQAFKDGPAAAIADNSARILVRPEPGVFIQPGQPVQVVFKAQFSDAKFHNGQQEQVELLLGSPVLTILSPEPPTPPPIAASAPESIPAPSDAA